jgi:hypothetical protein
VSSQSVTSGVPESEPKTSIARILALSSPTDGAVRLLNSTSTRSHVVVEVFDVAGRLAADLDQGTQEPGNHW